MLSQLSFRLLCAGLLVYGTASLTEQVSATTLDHSVAVEPMKVAHFIIPTTSDSSQGELSTDQAGATSESESFGTSTSLKTTTRSESSRHKSTITSTTVVTKTTADTFKTLSTTTLSKSYPSASFITSRSTVSHNTTQTSVQVTTTASVTTTFASLPSSTSSTSSTNTGNGTSSQAPTSTSVHHESANCLPGSECSWKLGVGLGFGSLFAVAAFFIASRRYRRHLEVSQRQHHSNWRDRRQEDEGSYMNEMQQPVENKVDLEVSGTTSHISTNRWDELYLSSGRQDSMRTRSED